MTTTAQTWGIEQTIGTFLALVSGTFVLGVLFWERIKNRRPFRYMRHKGRSSRH